MVAGNKIIHAAHEERKQQLEDVDIGNGEGCFPPQSIIGSGSVVSSLQGAETATHGVLVRN